MSTAGLRNSLSRAREFISSENGVIAPLPISEEELNPESQDDLTFQAYPLESTTGCYPIKYNYLTDSSRSEFSFFEDGRQRTVQIGYIPTLIGNIHVMLPVHFFVVAAVVLQRTECELKVWDKAEIVSGIFIEKSFVPNQSILEKFQEQGLLVVDTKVPKGFDYYDLRKRALQEAKKLRLEAEDKLIAKWRQSEETHCQMEAKRRSKRQLSSC